MDGRAPDDADPARPSGDPKSAGGTASSSGVSDPLDALLRDLADAPVEDPGERRGLRPGERVGRYQVVRELGRGGFGVVYEARDVELGRHVAVKALRADRLRRGSEEQRALRLSLLQKEAATVARLQHPNIVTLLDLVVQDGLPYLVLELLSGETLQASLQAGPLSPEAALDVAVQVARGLSHAHAAGVIHRDLKPSNVFRTHDGLVKLLDLGLARGLAGSDLLPRAGTPGFMAPEQWRGEGDERTDLFGLGMLLHALLGGRVPQIASATLTSRSASAQPPADASAGPAGAARAGGDSMPPLETIDVPASVPPPLAALIIRCCAQGPAQRPPSARVLLDELLALQRGRGEAASSPLLQQPGRPAGAVSTTEPVPRPPIPPARRPVRIFALVAMLLGAGLVPWMVNRRKPATLGAPQLKRSEPLAAPVAAAPAAPDTIVPVGSMASQRAGAAAVLLRNGLALVAGGAGEGGPVATAELFDPQAGRDGAFRAAGTLSGAREDAAIALLGDGRALIAGGEGRAGTLDTTEVFDPVNASFKPGPRLLSARSRAVLIALGDGRLLIAGGERDGVQLSSAELYDPDSSSTSPGSSPNLPNLPIAGSGIGAFAAAAPLHTARASAVAALLPDGSVLIAGGLGPEPLASAELFLPPPRGSGGAGTFVSAGHLSDARTGASALPLPGGHVLIAGGDQAGHALASVERYEPGPEGKDGARGLFQPLGPLVTPRHAAVALVLPAGDLLFAGGKGDNDSRLASAEVYDPFAPGPQPGAPPGVSRPLSNLSTPRGDAVAVLLANGRALIAGGDWGVHRALSSAEVYLPRGVGRTGRAVRTGDLRAPRTGACAVALATGRIVLAGGRGASALGALELFDPRAANGAGAFSIAGALLQPRELPIAALLPDGSVLVAGGLDDGGAPLASAELVHEDPAHPGRLLTAEALPLSTARAFAAAVRLADGRVLVAGGIGKSALLASAEIFDPAVPARLRADLPSPGPGAFSPTGPMSTPRGAPMAALLADGRVLIAGGSGPSDPLSLGSPAEGGDALASAELFDPRTGSFRPTGTMATARRGSVMLRLPSGKVLIAGGLGKGALASAELFDPLADEGRGAFSATGGLATARDGAAAALLPSGRALLLGGTDPSGGALASAELYDPTADDGIGGFEHTSGLSVGREACTATLLPGGGVLIAGGRNNGPLATAEIWKLE